MKKTTLLSLLSLFYVMEAFSQLIHPPTQSQVLLPKPDQSVEVVACGGIALPGSFTVIWTKASDPDGDDITYICELSTGQSFLNIIYREQATDTSLAISNDTLNYIRKNVLNVNGGASIPLYLRVNASDGTLVTFGDAIRFILSSLLCGNREDTVLWDTTVESVALYPNPAKGSFVVSLKIKETAKLSLTVVDVLGRVVFSLSPMYLARGEPFQTIVETKSWRVGHYFLRITMETTQTVFSKTIPFEVN